MLSDLLLKWEWQLAAINGLRLSKFEDSIIPLTFVRSDGVVYDIKSDGWNRNSQCGLTPIWQIVSEIQKEIIRLYVANIYLGYSFFSVKKLSNRELNERYSSLILDFPAHLFEDEQLAVETITNSLKTIKTPSETIRNSDCSILVLWNYKGSGNSKLKSTFPSLGWSKVYFGELSLDSTNSIWSSFGGNQYRFSFESDSVATIGDMFNINELENYLSYWFSVLLHDVPKNKHIGGGFVFHPASVKEEVLTSISIPFAFHNDEEIDRFYDNYRHLNIALHAFTAPLERRLRILQFAEKRDILSTRTAIGSIMSRNGSHNIGSHVLSALSHNVGTMPDDRVLYQYIQHRMDYIATATTDFPTWTQPTMLVGELMRDFFSQRHLLEHIAGSEGLSAWEFQNPNLTETSAKNQHGKIKLLLRRKNGEGAFVPVIDYDKAKDNVDLDQDVALAIPGGVVGNHAFYTILENVIRNAAKHGWSSLRQEVREQKNLEVTIDFEERDEKPGEVVFTVWDNMSNDDAAKEKSGKSLVERQGERLSQKLIDEGGRLRRENWGMAEIKISAGYLMSRGIDEIGGLVDGAPIVEPCAVKDGDVHRLGYQFSIRKPKDVVFVLGEGQKELLNMIGESRRSSLASQGIEFVELAKVAASADKNWFAARHVVLPHFGDKERFHGILPFRVLVWKGGGNVCSELVPELDLAKVRVALLEPNVQTVEALRRVVASAWLWHLRSHSNDKKVESAGLALVVNTVGDESNAGRGLITDDDILSFVFEHGLRTAIETFVETRDEPIPTDLQDVLVMLHAIYPERGEFEKYPEVEDVRAKIAWALLSRLQAVEHTFIAGKEFVLAALDNSRTRLHLGGGLLTERLADAKDFLKHNFGRPPQKNSTEGFADRMKHFERRIWWEKNPHPIGDFVLHLRSVFKETDVFLRKYEERLATLPAGFSSTGNNGKKSTSASVNWFGFVDYLPQKPDSSFAKAVANYTRHDQPGKTRAAGVVYHEPLSGTQSYLNALIQLSSKDPDKTAGADVLLEKLTENALLKICIADERMSKFLRDHQTLRDTYNAENILVIDEKWVENCLNLAKDPDEGNGHPDTGLCRPPTDVLRRIRDYVRSHGLSTSGELDGAWMARQIEGWQTPSPSDDFWQKGKVFDILVLHQGLIDKWLGEAAHSKSQIAIFLELLKQYVKYVVITTGRGTPANIPPGARVLPFPTLERTLFKMYPEKMVLVDTILNILPAHSGDKKGA